MTIAATAELLLAIEETMRLRAYLVFTTTNQLDVVAVVSQTRIEGFELANDLEHVADVVVCVSSHGFDVEKNRGELTKEAEIIKTLKTWLYDAYQL